MRFIINSHTLKIHLKRATEQCNLDDANKDDLKEVGWHEMQMLVEEKFRLCEHCWSQKEEEM